mmetsp:Transcript_52061/g.62648  ORF Transcript_52061/g.62648 Transcript_52061/m.62648 type:complete len:153 (-) Transcript_52061:458-916(-)
MPPHENPSMLSPRHQKNPKLDDIIRKQQLQWATKLAAMDDNRLPRRLITSWRPTPHTTTKPREYPIRTLKNNILSKLPDIDRTFPLNQWEHHIIKEFGKTKPHKKPITATKWTWTFTNGTQRNAPNYRHKTPLPPIIITVINTPPKLGVPRP